MERQLLYDRWRIGSTVGAGQTARTGEIASKVAKREIAIFTSSLGG
jgi:hypothetical protein